MLLCAMMSAGISRLLSIVADKAGKREPSFNGCVPGMANTSKELVELLPN